MTEKSTPQSLHFVAGYQNGYYYLKPDPDSPLIELRPLTLLGYKLQFLQEPFRKPIMLKKR
jgi:hypothetical protein